ncbi:hypothetical protein IKF57_01330 [Candidatus Saccharibacteria bacterium]|nr:hypothetical protein [Candidatus Saccharibacteria bacterium]
MVQLITFLLNAVAVLTFITGLAVLLGGNKKSRTSGFWFFLATVGAAFWAASIAMFLTLPEDMAVISEALIIGSVFGVTFTNVALVGYTGWSSRIGRIFTVSFLLLEAVFMGMMIREPGLFYSGITYGVDYNQLFIVNGWYLYLLMGFCGVVLTTYLVFLTSFIKRQRNPNTKIGYRIFQVGLLVGGVFALVFDLILATARPELIWIGPMEVGITVLLFYYSILRYRILVLTKHWIRILSYIIIVGVGIVAYMLIFYLVFTAIFKVASPSSGVLILNIVMAAIVLCLVPALSEISAIIKSLLPNRNVDVGYVAKKLDKLSTAKFDPKELAGFLEMNLKFDYIGLVVKDKLYNSNATKISRADLDGIIKAYHHGADTWQDVDDKFRVSTRIEKIAPLVDSRGRNCGWVLFGQPIDKDKKDFSARNMAQIEMVLKMVSTVISDSPIA